MSSLPRRHGVGTMDNTASRAAKDWNEEDPATGTDPTRSMGRIEGSQGTFAGTKAEGKRLPQRDGSRPGRGMRGGSVPKRRRGYHGGNNVSFLPYAPMAIDSDSRASSRRASAPTPPVAARHNERFTPGAAATMEQAVVLPGVGMLATDERSSGVTRSDTRPRQDPRRASDPTPPFKVPYFDRNIGSAGPTTLDQAIVIPEVSTLTAGSDDSKKLESSRSPGEDRNALDAVAYVVPPHEGILGLGSGSPVDARRESEGLLQSTRKPTVIVDEEEAAKELLSKVVHEGQSSESQPKRAHMASSIDDTGTISRDASSPTQIPTDESGNMSTVGRHVPQRSDDAGEQRKAGESTGAIEQDSGVVQVVVPERCSSIMGGAFEPATGSRRVADVAGQKNSKVSGNMGPGTGMGTDASASIPDASIPDAVSCNSPVAEGEKDTPYDEDEEGKEARDFVHQSEVSSLSPAVGVIHTIEEVTGDSESGPAAFEGMGIPHERPSAGDDAANGGVVNVTANEALETEAAAAVDEDGPGSSPGSVPVQEYHEQVSQTVSPPVAEVRLPGQAPGISSETEADQDQGVRFLEGSSAVTGDEGASDLDPLLSSDLAAAAAAAASPEESRTEAFAGDGALSTMGNIEQTVEMEHENTGNIAGQSKLAERMSEDEMEVETLETLDHLKPTIDAASVSMAAEDVSGVEDGKPMLEGEIGAESTGSRGSTGGDSMEVMVREARGDGVPSEQLPRDWKRPDASPFTVDISAAPSTRETVAMSEDSSTALGGMTGLVNREAFNSSVIICAEERGEPMVDVHSVDNTQDDRTLLIGPVDTPSHEEPVCVDASTAVAFPAGEAESSASVSFSIGEHTERMIDVDGVEEGAPAANTANAAKPVIDASVLLLAESTLATGVAGDRSTAVDDDTTKPIVADSQDDNDSGDDVEVVELGDLNATSIDVALGSTSAAAGPVSTLGGTLAGSHGVTPPIETEPFGREAFSVENLTGRDGNVQERGVDFPIGATDAPLVMEAEEDPGTAVATTGDDVAIPHVAGESMDTEEVSVTAVASTVDDVAMPQVAGESMDTEEASVTTIATNLDGIVIPQAVGESMDAEQARGTAVVTTLDENVTPLTAGESTDAEEAPSTTSAPTTGDTAIPHVEGELVDAEEIPGTTVAIILDETVNSQTAAGSMNADEISGINFASTAGDTAIPQVECESMDAEEVPRTTVGTAFVDIAVPQVAGDSMDVDAEEVSGTTFDTTVDDVATPQIGGELESSVSDGPLDPRAVVGEGVIVESTLGDVETATPLAIEVFVKPAATTSNSCAVPADEVMPIRDTSTCSTSAPAEGVPNDGLTFSPGHRTTDTSIMRESPVAAVYGSVTASRPEHEDMRALEAAGTKRLGDYRNEAGGDGNASVEDVKMLHDDPSPDDADTGAGVQVMAGMDRSSVGVGSPKLQPGTGTILVEKGVSTRTTVLDSEPISTVPSEIDAGEKRTHGLAEKGEDFESAGEVNESSGDFVSSVGIAFSSGAVNDSAVSNGASSALIARATWTEEIKDKMRSGKVGKSEKGERKGGVDRQGAEKEGNPIRVAVDTACQPDTRANTESVDVQQGQSSPDKTAIAESYRRTPEAQAVLSSSEVTSVPQGGVGVVLQGVPRAQTPKFHSAASGTCKEVKASKGSDKGSSRSSISAHGVEAKRSSPTSSSSRKRRTSRRMASRAMNVEQRASQTELTSKGEKLGKIAELQPPVTTARLVSSTCALNSPPHVEGKDKGDPYKPSTKPFYNVPLSPPPPPPPPPPQPAVLAVEASAAEEAGEKGEGQVPEELGDNPVIPPSRGCCILM